ncbi:MAG: deoxyribodipyrimidine photo-lyase [Gammaproteobacteria bacterium]|nr:deoxyribodipyrimidine photo-lyase [Gammaproteobacteria bacterium]
MTTTTLLWLRQDLRLTDNTALELARKSDQLLPVYIHDPKLNGRWPPGAASDWWLHHSLASLDEDLRKSGSRLILGVGPTEEVLKELIRSGNVNRVCWNRRYEPDLVDADRQLKKMLAASGLEVKTCNSNLLFEPWDIQRDTKTESPAPYRVFTAYWRACNKRGLHDAVHHRPDRLPGIPRGVPSRKLESLGLMPETRRDTGLRNHWQPGEKGAQIRLDKFLKESVEDYTNGRNQPGITGTSGISPHLHFGEIGPRQIIHAIKPWTERATGSASESTETYIREIGWREFAHHLLFHYPQSDQHPLNRRFRNFSWRKDYGDDLIAWQQGNTGIPLVDAGMRELWQTGWMHNRVRMIVASFLAKNLMIPWQQGARWFWDTLVDADLASNTLGWQWVAGCGADAAPYFRIFNPVLQGEKFDPEGTYVRRWIPELKALPNRYIHKPWTAPQSLQAGIAPYPPPIVDLKASRERALAAYRQL